MLATFVWKKVANRKVLATFVWKKVANRKVLATFFGKKVLSWLGVRANVRLRADVTSRSRRVRKACVSVCARVNHRVRAKRREI